MNIAYSRKSREDMELEKTSGIDTLQRHREIIKQTAKYWNLTIDEWYEEVVSGETIEARPKIQEVLYKVDLGLVEHVIVVDIDRLARGDTADQARISKSFAFSYTKIVTPNKIYDPNNEADEEFFEFSLFMSRREYKTINRRLNRGRLSSVNEGKFVGSVCPYGYTKEKLKGQKGFKLVILDEEAKIVKTIFDMASQNTGSSNIANHLNKIGSKPRKSEVWVSATIRDIIANPVYYGMIKWNWRKVEKRMINGIIYKTRPKHKEYILVKGLHEPIITKELWDLANNNIKIRAAKSVKKSLTMQNPLSGLVKCEFCGRTMQRRNYRSGHIDGLICPLPHCQNIGSHLYLVEDAILNSLKSILKDYNQMIIDFEKEENINNSINNTAIEILKKEIEKTESQLTKTYELLEQGLYDSETFLKRNNQLKEKIKELNNELDKYNLENTENNLKKIKNTIPKLEYIINNYSVNLSPAERNELLKNTINQILYKKIVKGKGHENEFTLKIDIKI